MIKINTKFEVHFQVKNYQLQPTLESTEWQNIFPHTGYPQQIIMRLCIYLKSR